LTNSRCISQNFTQDNQNNPWGFSLRGIRAEGRCPKCKGRFKKDINKGFLCTTCLTRPERFLIDFWYEGERIRRGTTLDGRTLRSFVDANALLRQAENEIEAKRFDVTKWKAKEQKEFNFKTLVMQWYEDKKDLMENNERAPSYVPILLTYIEHYFLPFFGHMDVRDIRTTTIKTFKKQLVNMSPKSKKLSLKYQKNILDALNHFFECLVNDDIIAINDKPKIPHIKVPEHAFNVISPEIQSILLDYISKEHHAIFTFLFNQGCRPSEARALKWDCIEDDVVTYKRTWSRRMLKETTKTDSIRKNLLFDETLSILPNRRFPSDFVFSHGKKKQPYSADLLNRLFNKAVQKFNEKLEEGGETIRLEITLYEATKHSFGTYMHNKLGVTLEILQKHFGHVKIETVLKYTKLQAVDTFREIQEKRKKVVSIRENIK